LAAAKHWFGSCQTRVWWLPLSGLAAAKLGLGSWASAKIGVWQLPNSGLAAAKLGLGSCQTRVWHGSCLAWQLGSRQNQVRQLPQSGLAAAKLLPQERIMIIVTRVRG